jgi:hypothetical protein
MYTLLVRYIRKEKQIICEMIICQSILSLQTFVFSNILKFVCNFRYFIHINIFLFIEEAESQGTLQSLALEKFVYEIKNQW